jgi:hypothetical protein
MPESLCRKCGSRLDQVLIDMQMFFHPSCEGMTIEQLIKANVLEDLTDIIRWTDNNSARSLQSTIGPSELGTECDRKIAYRIAGVAETNQWMDPLPAIVGTAVHGWLEKAVNHFQKVHYMDRWETEITVQPDPIVTGHCDLYDRQYAMVIDWKTVSPTKLKEWKRKGPPEHYKTQVNLYAKGLLLTGRPVNRVALVAVPRSGWLTDVDMWVDEYRPELAQAALDRLYGIADKLMAQGDQLDPDAIPAMPGDGCSYCPWYRGGTKSADLSGCPGNVEASKAKFMKGLGKNA